MFGFSVQLFTTPSIVRELLPRGLLLRVLLGLDYAIHAAASLPGGTAGVGGERISWPLAPPPPPHQAAPDHAGRVGLAPRVPPLNCEAAALTHRRYDFALRDLVYVLSIDGVASQLTASSALLSRWLDILRRLQLADPQRRYLSAHVEHESRAWLQAFNLHLSLSSAFHAVFKPLADLQPDLDLAAATVAPHTTVHSPEAPPGAPLLSPASFEFARRQASAIGAAAFHALADWMASAELTSAFSTVELPLPPGVACDDGCFYAHSSDSGHSTNEAFSFHLPLHRFLAALTREVAALDASSAGDLLAAPLQAYLDSDFPPSGIEARADEVAAARRRLLWKVLEHPMRTATLAAQVSAGLWKRNGQIMLLQLVNYASPPLCLKLRDLDLLSMQVPDAISTHLHGTSHPPPLPPFSLVQPLLSRA